jgi:hypothetical protein
VRSCERNVIIRSLRRSNLLLKCWLKTMTPESHCEESSTKQSPL